MQTYLGLKIAFFAAIALFVISAAAVAVRALRGGSANADFGRSLQRPWVLAWVLMGLSLASLPFTGWWLAHVGAWPLGQTWMLVSEVLYVGVWVFGWLTLRRVARLRHAQVYPAAADKPDVAAQRKRAFIYSSLCVGSFAAIVLLVAIKPV